MALDARRRSSLYEHLAPLVGEDNANALMSEFPSVEAQELVTKQFLRAEIASLRGDLNTELARAQGERSSLRADMNAELAHAQGERSSLRADMNAELAHAQGERSSLRADMNTDISDLRADMHTGFARIDTELAELQRDLTVRMVAIVATCTGMATAILGTLTAVS